MSAPTPAITITRRLEFDAGHRIPHHDGQCRHLHGHRYAIELTVSGDVLETPGAADDGMLLDFGDIKRLANDHLVSLWDHAFLVAKEDQARHQALLTQIKALDGQNQAQARATAKLGDQLNTSRAELSKLTEATRKLETMLNAERQRPAAIAPGVATIRPREKPVEQKDKEFVQFPDPQAQKTETAKPNR